MILFDETKFMQKQYVKNLAAKINESLVDGFLTHEAVNNLAQDNLFRIWGVQRQDVRHINFSQLNQEDFNKIPFSSSTIFPNDMPSFFDKNKILTFKHSSFVADDKNVCLAIIDNPSQFYLHEFFKNKNVELVDYSAKTDETHFHMDGVLSNIFKYANNPKIIAYAISWRKRHKSVLKALKDVYRRIKKGQEIHVISISNMLTDKTTKQGLKNKIEKMVGKLKDLDCEVIDSLKFSQELNFTAADKPMFEKEQLSAYKYTFNIPTRMGVPTSRVVTEFGSEKGFAISGGGQSWAIPIVSYFYAYCKNKDVNLTLQDFSKLCDTASRKTKNCNKIVDFKKVVLSFEQHDQ